MTARAPYGGLPPSVSEQPTSVAAALSLLPVVAPMRERVRAVLAEIAKTSLVGATSDELERWLGLKHQTVTARVRELVLLEQVEDSGLRRKTAAGRAAVVWRVRRGQAHFPF